jgi:hypothetical protein
VHGQGSAFQRGLLTWLEFISNLRTTLMATSPSCWPVVSRARYTLLKAPSPIFSSRVQRSSPGYLGSLPLASRSSATMRSSTVGSMSLFVEPAAAAACCLCCFSAARAATSPAWAALLRLSTAAAEKAPWWPPPCTGWWSRMGSLMPACFDLGGVVPLLLGVDGRYIGRGLGVRGVGAGLLAVPQEVLEILNGGHV